MSKRERMIGGLTVAGLGGLGIYQFIVRPLSGRKADLDARVDAAQHDLEAANRVFTTSRRAAHLWAEMDRGALLRDESAAESRMLNSVREWAQEAGMNLSSLKPERSEREGGLNKISFRA